MQRSLRKIDWTATLALLGAMLCWSVVPLFLRYLRDFVHDGWTTNGFRYPIGTLLYLPAFCIAWKNRNLYPRLWTMALLPFVVNIVGQTLWAWAPYYIDPGLIAFLARSMIIWAAIGSFIVFRDERALLRSPRFGVGMGLAFIGLACIIAFSDWLTSRSTAIGVLIIIGTGMCWAVYGIAMRLNMRTVPVGLAFFVVSLYTSSACLIMMFAWGDAAQVPAAPPLAVAILALSAVVGIAAAHGLYFIAIRSLGVAISTGAGMMTPFITSAVSYFLYDERLAPMQWIGGIILFAGAVIMIWAQQHLGREQRE